MSITPLLDGAVIEGRIRMESLLADIRGNEALYKGVVSTVQPTLFKPVNATLPLPRWQQARIVLRAVLDGLILMCPPTYTVAPSLRLRSGVAVALNPRYLGAEVHDTVPEDHWTAAAATAYLELPDGVEGVVFLPADCKEALADWVVVWNRNLFHPEGRVVAPLGRGRWRSDDPFLIVGSTTSPLADLRARRAAEDAALQQRNAEVVKEQRRVARENRKRLLLANVSMAFRGPRTSTTLFEPAPPSAPPPIPTLHPDPQPVRQITTRGRRGSYAVPASEAAVRSAQSPDYFIACLCKEMRAGCASMESFTLCMHGEALSQAMIICVLDALSEMGANHLGKVALLQSGIDTSGLLVLAEWALRYPTCLCRKLDGPSNTYPDLCTTLHTLDISGNKLVQSDLSILEVALLPLVSLRSLSLRNNATLRYVAEGSKGAGFTSLTPLLRSLEGRIEHLDLGLCFLNSQAVIKLCSFLQEESMSPVPAEYHEGGYVRGRLSRVNIDGATINQQVATYLLQTVVKNECVVEFGVGLVSACSSGTYLSQLESSLAENIETAISRCGSEVDRPPAPHPPLSQLAELGESRRAKLLKRLQTGQVPDSLLGLVEQAGKGSKVHEESPRCEGDEEVWVGELSPGYAAYTSNTTRRLPKEGPRLHRVVETLAQLNPILL